MRQPCLLPEPAPRWTRLGLPDADVRLLRGFLEPADADALFRGLRGAISWRQDAVTVYGRTHPLPRLHRWFGDPGLAYAWSGVALAPAPWLPELLAAKGRVEAAAAARFNTVLANLYRDGADTVGWHADDEPELGDARDVTIASVSLGAERDFALRHREHGTVTVALPHGSLLVMAGATQAAWQHAMPRRRRVTGERINLTFRHVVSQRGTR